MDFNGQEWVIPLAAALLLLAAFLVTQLLSLSSFPGLLSATDHFLLPSLLSQAGHHSKFHFPSLSRLIGGICPTAWME